MKRIRNRHRIYGHVKGDTVEADEMKVVGYLAVFVAGIVACYLLLSLGVVDAVDGLPGSQEEPILSLPTYLSFIGVMMTTVTVVLAALAIGIGVVAAFTFRGIDDVARKTAGETAKSVADEALSEVKVRKLVYELYAKAVAQPILQDELKPEFDATDNGER